MRKILFVKDEDGLFDKDPKSAAGKRPVSGDTIELRARLFVEEKIEPTPRLVINLSGFAEGLLARRPDLAGRSRRC